MPPPASPPQPQPELQDHREARDALARLDLATRQVAEAVSALGGHDPERLHALLGVNTAAGAAAVSRAVGALAEAGLLTARGGLHPATREVWPTPLGLGIPAAEAFAEVPADGVRVILAAHAQPAGRARKAELLAQLTALLGDGARIRALVAELPGAARDLLERLAVGEEVLAPVPLLPRLSGTGSAARSEPPPARRPAEQLGRLGLAVRRPSGSWLCLPAEVALALRGPRWQAPFDPRPPALAWHPVDARTVLQQGGAAAATTAAVAAAALDALQRSPLPPRRAGGIGRRGLAGLAAACGAPPEEVRLVLALARQAGLVRFSDRGLAPAAAAHAWRRLPPAARLAGLLPAWLDLPELPLLDPEGDWSPPADGDQSLTPALRRVVLEELAGAPAGTPAATLPTLAAGVAWRLPQGCGDAAERTVGAVMQEASLLGVTGAGALTPAGRTLLAAGTPARLAAALGDLGALQRRADLQTDLTAVVLGTPDPELAALLDLLADREGQGAAITWRFSAATVRRAFDAGHDADGVLAALAGATTGSLPQPLVYLVRDVARSHGAVRALRVSCCLRAEDPALLVRLVRDRRLAGLGLRLLAPTVVAAQRPPAQTLAALRSAGYAPVEEDVDGVVVLPDRDLIELNGCVSDPAGR